MAPAVAYGETRHQRVGRRCASSGPASGSTRIEIRKGETGIVRGAAHVEWAGSYSFNVDARQIPVESVDMLAFPQAPLTGHPRLHLVGQRAVPRSRRSTSTSACATSSSGTRASATCEGRLEMRGDDVNFSFDAASTRLARVRRGQGDAARRLSGRRHHPHHRRVARPVRARCSRPSLSPFATAVASGTRAHQRHAGQPRQHRGPAARRQARREAVRLPACATTARSRPSLEQGLAAHRPVQARRARTRSSP
ncbi:MAG: hypothetical protein MZV64_13740 [Ignavibacteriales bacterium]|nr:hypothetical protein [Ignavibacteriales bacterium]